MYSSTSLITSTLALALTGMTAAAAIEKRGYGPAPNGKTICPGGQGLFFRAKSGLDYQVACAVDTSGGDLLAVYPNMPDALACAAQCDLWSQQVPTRKCVTSSWYIFSSDGVNNCLIRGGNFVTFENQSALNAISAIQS